MFTKKLSRVLDGAELSESDVHADAGVDIAEGRFEDAQDVSSCILLLHHAGLHDGELVPLPGPAAAPS